MKVLGDELVDFVLREVDCFHVTVHRFDRMAVYFRMLPLSTMGFLQSFGPTLHFLVALLVFREPLDHAKLVDKVFTYTTPHNGIEAGILGNVPGWLSFDGINAFNRDEIARVLTLIKQQRDHGVIAGGLLNCRGDVPGRASNTKYTRRSCSTTLAAELS